MPALASRALPSVAIVIPARDGVERLALLLDALAREAPSNVAVEVVVVDDGSAPPLEISLGGALREASVPQIIRLEESQGPAHARNLGVRETSSPVVFFLDADVLYVSGAIEAALEILEAHPDIGAVSFLNQPYCAADNTAANFGASMEHFWHAALIPGGESFGACGGFTSRNGAVRRSAYEAIGGFDTTYQTNAHEDYDFGKRLAAHTRTVIAASPRLYHAFPGRIRRIVRNYWVRTSLFVPYALKFRPPMDPTQVSEGEALVRLTGAGPLVFLAIAAVPAPLPVWMRLGALLGAFAGLGIYAERIRDFLGACRKWSGSSLFAVQAFGLHYLTSLVILAGGVNGLLQHLRGRAPARLQSPLR